MSFATDRIIGRILVERKESANKAEITKQEEEFPLDLNLNKLGIVYLLGSNKGKILKIGYTTNLDKRLKNLQRSCPYTLEIIKTKVGTFEDERKLLQSFKQFKLQGEWFTWDESIIEGF